MFCSRTIVGKPLEEKPYIASRQDAALPSKQEKKKEKETARPLSGRAARQKPHGGDGASQGESACGWETRKLIVWVVDNTLPQNNR